MTVEQLKTGNDLLKKIDELRRLRSDLKTYIDSTAGWERHLAIHSFPGNTNARWSLIDEEYCPMTPEEFIHKVFDNIDVKLRDLEYDFKNL